MKAALASAGAELWRRAALGGGLMAALVLLAVFYSTVAGAVDRAAASRRTAQATVQPSAQRVTPQVIAATTAVPAGSARMMPRDVSYVRPAH